MLPVFNALYLILTRKSRIYSINSECQMLARVFTVNKKIIYAACYWPSPSWLLLLFTGKINTQRHEITLTINTWGRFRGKTEEPVSPVAWTERQPAGDGTALCPMQICTYRRSGVPVTSSFQGECVFEDAQKVQSEWGTTVFLLSSCQIAKMPDS